MKDIDIGKLGEEATQEYLLNKGFALVDSNYHSRYGEIDIICEDDKYIVFVEVKTRKNGSLVRGIHAVNIPKREKIIKTALMYFSEYGVVKQPRFDVAEVIVNKKGECEKINYYENAFDTEELGAFF